MMQRLTAMAAVFAALLILSGCYHAPVKPPIGLIYTNTASTIDTDAQGEAVSMKKGMAKTECVLGCVAWGDSSVKAATDSAGINRIDHIDYEFKNIIGVYQKFTTVVYGE